MKVPVRRMREASVEIRSYVFLPIDRVIYGPGSITRLPEEVERIGATRVTVTTTGSIARGTALLAQVRDLLGDRVVAVYAGVRQHTPSSAVTELCKELKASEAELVVSLGGGSVIDATKAAVLAVARDTGSFLPHIAVPTTLSASEFSPLFGVTDESTKAKAGGDNPFVTPRVAILDAELTRDTPDWLWTSSGIRAVDHAVETVYAPDHGPVTDATALEAIRLLFQYLPESRSKDAVHERQQCQLAAWLSFFGVENITLGPSHLLGRQIGPRYDVPHGYTSAVLLPRVMEALLPETAARQALVAWAAGAAPRDASPEDAAQAAPAAVRDLVSHLDLPHTLQELGVPEEDLDHLSAGRVDIRSILQAAW